MLACVVVCFAALGRQGADLFWGVALGDRIRAGNGVPQSVVFAESPSDDWANPMALGEVLLSVVHSLGSPALFAMHLTLVAASLGVLVGGGVTIHQREARAGLALLLVALGGAPTLAIARMPSLSLLPYAALVVLLLRQADRPSGRLWLAVPLLCVWGNLHGGVLVGVALLAVHLILCKGPLQRRILVGMSASVLVLMATSAGWRTLDYYRGVLSNEAAKQHSGLWAQPSLHKPFDAVMLLAAIGLIVAWTGSRPRRWELVAVTGMIIATLVASRNSIWLLLFLLPIAARGRSRSDTIEQHAFPWKPATAAVALLSLGVGWQLSARGSALDADGAYAVPVVRKLAAGGTVLAINPVDETFAQAGVRVWAGNPIDAFPPHVQREFLAFMSNGVIPPDPSIDLIVVNEHLAQQIRSAGWREVASISDLVVFERRR